MAKIKYSKTRGLQKVKKEAVAAKIVDESAYYEMRNWTAKEVQNRNNESADTAYLATKIRITNSNSRGNLNPEIENAISQAGQYFQEKDIDTSIASIDILNDVLPLCLNFEKKKSDPLAEKFIKKSEKKIVSLKTRNVFFNLDKLLIFIGDLLTFDLSFSEADAIKLIVNVFKLIYEGYLAISIEFEEEDAAIILLLHQYSSRNIGITEEKFIDIVINENSEMQREEIMDRINKLHSYRCIDIDNGNIYLVEKL